ncbi:MAG: hypothetical protein C0468_05530 [Planctomyces sp.]|nr:hypothetical protein [Planctomyces sp.]
MPGLDTPPGAAPWTLARSRCARALERAAARPDDTPCDDPRLCAGLLRLTCVIVGAAAALLLAAAFQGCAAGPAEPTAGGDPAAGATPTAQAAEDPFLLAANQLEDALRRDQERRALDGAPLPVDPSAAQPALPGVRPAPTPVTAPVAQAGATPPTAGPAEATVMGPPEPPPAAERRAAALRDLAALLEARAAAEGTPLDAAISLALLAGLDPNDAGLRQRLESLTRALSPSEAQGVALVRELAAALRDGSGAAGDPERLAGVLRQLAERSAGPAPLRLPRVDLAERVEAFGRYRGLPSHVFLAGRAARALLYTEIDGFTHTGSSQTDTADLEGAPLDSAGLTDPAVWVVRLGQEVNLYHTDGTLAWRVPEQVVVDRSKNQRRDFFLVQRLELPPTLSIGSYQLKVSVRDKASGQETEAIIPIRVVADPALQTPAPQTPAASLDLALQPPAPGARTVRPDLAGALGGVPAAALSGGVTATGDLQRLLDLLEQPQRTP